MNVGPLWPFKSRCLLQSYSLPPIVKLSQMPGNLSFWRKKESSIGVCQEIFIYICKYQLEGMEVCAYQ